MGANIELDIFLKKGNPPLKAIFSLLERKGLYISIEHAKAFDNWQYENMSDISQDVIELDTSDIFLKKFTLINFSVNKTWPCVLITSFEDAYLDLSFALDSEPLIGRTHNDINVIKSFIYDEIIEAIDKSLSQKIFKGRFLAASMGVEYSVEFKTDIVTTLKDDNGVARWVLPKVIGKSIDVEQFAKEEKSNTTVFTRLPPV